MKAVLKFATMFLVALFTMSACTAKGSDKVNMHIKSEANPKILVVYFSWSGNTKTVGQHIAQKTHADVFEVERVKPYPSQYEQCVEEAHAEIGKRPTIKGEIKNLSDYDVIFIGVPVWSGSLPMPMFTFLEQYDFTGKKVIPFCTCYSSEGNSLNDIIKATPNSEHRKGLCIETQELAGKGLEKDNAKIDKWLKDLGLINI